MNLLNKIKYKLANIKGYLSTSATKQNLMLEQLTSRTLLRVAGNDCQGYLQGLITNDISHLSRLSNAIYTMFLNKQGRVLYDSIIYNSKQENTFYVECDTSISNELVKHLKLFRVRRKIDIDVIDDEMKVWAAYHPTLDFNHEQINLSKLGLLWYIDPRVKSIGLRILSESDRNSDNIKFMTNQLENIQFEDGFSYQETRYRFGITEGVNELPPGKCFPLESNCDYLHGVSFHKGCYIGQELTARTHHTGVVRKRIMPIILTEPIQYTQNMPVEDADKKSLGVLRGVKNKYAIGLLRVDKVLGAKVLLAGGVVCKTERPKWWPREESILEKKMDNTSETKSTENLQAESTKLAKREKIHFQCYACNMTEMCDYFGKSPPFVRKLKFTENCFIMKDPFAPPSHLNHKLNLENFLILGKKCCICDKTVCCGAECSFYYYQTFCLDCVKINIAKFPIEIQSKINRIIFSM